MTWLLDGNVLAALAIDGHEHHRRALRWFDSQKAPFATCAITQGTLLRVHLATAPRPSAAAAWDALRRIAGHADHLFWGDDLSYAAVEHAGIVGPRQVTDAWLAALAIRHRSKVATLDAAFAALYPRQVELLP